MAGAARRLEMSERYTAKIGDVVTLGCGTGTDKGYLVCAICQSKEYRIIEIASKADQIIVVAPVHKPECEFAAGPHCKSCHCGGMRQVKVEQAYCGWYVRDNGLPLVCGDIIS